MAGVSSEQLQENLLAHGEERLCEAGNLKGTTRTGRILQYPRPLRVVALMRLNCRVPNVMHGGVEDRGCEKTPQEDKKDLEPASGTNPFLCGII